MSRVLKVKVTKKDINFENGSNYYSLSKPHIVESLNSIFHAPMLKTNQSETTKKCAR